MRKDSLARTNGNHKFAAGLGWDSGKETEIEMEREREDTPAPHSSPQQLKIEKLWWCELWVPSQKEAPRELYVHAT